MKHSNHILVLLLVLLCNMANAQNVFEKDSVLKNLRDSLPKGWVMKQKDSLLIIARTKPIYRTGANHINENYDPHKHDKVTTDDDPPPANGRKDTMKFVLKISPKWSDENYKRAEERNDTLRKKIDKLRSLHKYGGENKYISRGKGEKSEVIKGDSVIHAFNRKLEDTIDILEKQKITMPEYCTQFFFLSYPPRTREDYMELMFTDVFPWQAELESHKIENLLVDICACYWMYHKKE